MQWIAKLFGSRDEETLPLYTAIVARAREPHWYEAGAVPDTIDGRFDMVATALSFVLLRLEDDPVAAGPSAKLTERFVEDMDGQLREIGIGDIVVGKHIGKMMSMLGGRLGAYREGLATGDIAPALVRNLYRGTAPDDAALAHVCDSVMAFHAGLATKSLPDLLAGDLP
ncbi:MAG: ubiquinol-cytochrome C chaperone family protein [Sphingomonas sp.]